jgi:cyclase
MQQTTHELPASEHFDLIEVAAGAYAAIGTEGGGAYSNAGIVDLGDQTLIFDTFQTVRAAQDLRAAAEHLTGRRATAVIISHAHGDHWMGNQVFADHAPIIATREIREQMSATAENIKQLQEDPSELNAMVQQNEVQLQAETDEGKRASLMALNARWRRMLEMLPTLELWLPNQTFDGKHVFHGTQRTAELLTMGKGHTSSDCYLVLPEERVAFVGDLAFFQSQPFMGYCDPEAWKAQLEGMERSDVETFVPGHGPVGTKANVALLREYITALEDMVSRIVARGGTVEDALQQPLPDPFDAWISTGRDLFETNVRSSYQRLSGES